MYRRQSISGLVCLYKLLLLLHAPELQQWR